MRRDEIENQAVARLTIAMDTAHPLFQPIGVPRNVVVEHDVAALKIDALASGLRCDEHLNRAFTELLFGVESAPLHITRADLHSSVDESDFETPVGELADEIVERVFELGEN